VDWQGLLLMPPPTAAQIAERLGQPKDLVERTLRYFRTQSDHGFIKDDDAVEKLPSFLPGGGDGSQAAAIRATGTDGRTARAQLPASCPND